MSDSKPFIFTDEASDIERYNEANIDSMLGAFDSSYIPGYSETVQANAIAETDNLDFSNAHRNAVSGARTKEDWYKKIGAKPQPLPVYFIWLRTAGVSGDRSYSADVEVANYTRRGWRLATEDDLGRHGFGWPPAAQKAADGQIRRLDTALFVIDAGLENRYRRLLKHTPPDDDTPKVGENTQVPISSTRLDSGQFSIATKE
jgi:hypothetical protein